MGIGAGVRREGNEAKIKREPKGNRKPDLGLDAVAIRNNIVAEFVLLLPASKNVCKPRATDFRAAFSLSHII